ncbi:MAG: DUF3426 domain-containing protein [Rhodanobacter sp.]
MARMYTQCPDCLTVFSLDVETLSQARGCVVCAYCNTEFDALASLADQLPPEPFERLPVHAPSTELLTLEWAVYRPQPEPPVMLLSESATLDAATTSGEPTTPPDDDFSQLVFTPRANRGERRRKRQSTRKQRSRHSGVRRWPWVIACLLLTSVLVSQVAWAERDTLIRNPTTGPWLRHTCAAFGCQLPLVSAPTKLHLVASNVQAHPSVAGALMISANVRNDAAFAQPYPTVSITLSNAQGQRLAMRRLRPQQYMDDQAALQRGLAPGASTVLLLEVQDPGDKAVAFEFGFN